MDLAGKRAAPLKRTSKGAGGDQDPENQTPRLSAFIAENRMREVEGWTVAASAFNDDKWSRTFEMIRRDYDAGKFEVLVVLRANRFARRAKKGLRRLWDLQDAGMIVLSVEDPEFSVEGEFSVARLAMKLEIAEEDSKAKSRAVRDGTNRIDATGAWRGKPPTGYVTTGPKYSKRLVPGPKAQTVKDAVEAIADGMSRIQATRTYGINERTLSRIIDSDDYVTGLFPTSPVTRHKAEPLLTRDVQIRARRTVASRRGRRERQPWGGGLYSALLTCGECDGRLYAKKWEETREGRPGSEYHYYMCKANHAYRMEAVEDAVDERMLESAVLRVTLRYEGEENDAELRQVEAEMAAWNPATGDMDELATMRARKSELEDKAGGLVPVRTSTAYRALWRRWTLQEKRNAMATGEIAVTVSKPLEVQISYPLAMGSAVPRVKR